LNDDNHSVMYPSLGLGLTRRNFSNYDYAWLQHLYAGATDPGSNGTPEQVDAQVTAAGLPGLDGAIVDVSAAPRAFLRGAATATQNWLPADQLPAPGGSLPATIVAAALPPFRALLTVIVEGQGRLANHQQLLSPALPSLSAANEAGLGDNAGRGPGAELYVAWATASPAMGSSWQAPRSPGLGS
jgi:hypothetical protein